MTGTILAIDLGKYKSVACLCRAGRRLSEGTGISFCRATPSGGRQSGKRPLEREKRGVDSPVAS
jgi:hypothetical protein